VGRKKKIRKIPKLSGGEKNMVAKRAQDKIQFLTGSEEKVRGPREDAKQ